MKTIGMVLALVAGCVDSGATGSAQLALTGSGSGSGSGSGGGGGPTTVWHSTQLGRSAAANGSDPASGAFFNLNAWENGTGASRTASVSFFFQGPDPASQYCYQYWDPFLGWQTYCYYGSYVTEYGWGQIPTTDFQVAANASSAHLHTTTGPGFLIQTCRFDPYYGYYCSTGTSSKTLDVLWNDSHVWRTMNNGTSDTTSGNFTYRSTGIYTSHSADVSGTALGATFSPSNSFGQISDSKGNVVQRDVVTGAP